jgi:hypothetical protein
MVECVLSPLRRLGGRGRWPLDGIPVGDSWGTGGSPRPWFGASGLRAFSTLGPLFAWRTPDGRVYWTDTDDFDQVTTTGAVDPASYSGPLCPMRELI